MNKNQPPIIGQPRFSELDALRGIAALSVVVWHFYCTINTMTVHALQPLINGLNFFINGRASVILFFVLSGFVLSLPFFKEPQPQYLPFVLKRICRIYLPYLAGIIFAILIRTFVVVKPTLGLSAWFNNYCGAPFSSKIALEHLSLIGNIHSLVYNNAIWSLIHEMRISLLFPFILFFVLRVNPLLSMLMCLLLTGITEINDACQWEISYGGQTGYVYSLHFASFFIIGILLADNKELLVRTYNRLNIPLKIILFTGSIILFRQSMNWGFDLFNDYGAALGSVGLIVISLGSRKASNLLKKPFFKLLGNCSYSIYLNHITILYLAFYFLYPHVPIPIIGIIILVSVVIFSFFTWKYVELPAIALGKVLSKKSTRVRKQS